MPKSKLLIRDLVTPLNGFFSTILNPVYDTYWDNSDIDLRFFTEYGERTISPILEYYVEKIPNAQNVEEWGITTANKTLLATAFYKQFYRNWQHLLQVNHIIDTEDWSPLYNYELHVKTDKTEFTPGVKETVEQKGTETTAQKGKEKRGEAGKEKDTGKNEFQKIEDESNTENKRNVFNTAEPVDTDNSKNINKYKDRTDTENTKEFIDRESTIEFEDRETELSFTGRKQEKSFTGKDTTEHTKDEYGSLGVSSAADQVIKNIEAMERVDLAGYIVRDLAKFLTIPLYDMRRYRYKEYEN